ncbi:hypothetical protein AB0B57_03125 [Micromonospora sp. NPDC049101]|uniref:mycothiol-dependent nitroreductase Rv2466c family protein n=1 Tax=unclassified Micromonospora TaxID=2617518 RepID=UPI0033F97CA4
MTSVKFWSDPACYWSWRAGQWLTSAAEQRTFDIDWQPFSLKVLYGEGMDPSWATMLGNSHGALRIGEALRHAGRATDAVRFYVAVGTATHDNGEPLTEDLLRQAAKSTGVDDTFDAFQDTDWDDAITAGTNAAIASAGPDVGSPVIELPDTPRGIHGPVFERIPPSEEAGELYDAILRLARAPYFYEIKRGRSS